MRRYVWLIGILIVAMLAMAFVAGCGKKQASETAAPGVSKGTAGGGANELGDLMSKQAALTSYVMVVDAAGQKQRMALKMDQGKPVAMKVESPQSWVIMRMDKKMQYIYNPQTKTAMVMPMSGSPGSAPGAPPVPAVPDAAAIKALTDAKVTSETIDGVDCLKVAKADGSEAYWVEKEHGLPVQILANGKTTKIKYEQVNSVPDSEFELPAGVKTQEMPKMPSTPSMPNMPNVPKQPGG
jgi:outer membrane lipoprotein-sorting protein